jgi:uncharacterized protein (TIGR02466 family)
MVELQALFSVPIFRSRLVDADFNQALAALLIDYEKQKADAIKNHSPNMRIQSNVFESNFGLFGWKDPLIQRLAQFCTQSLWRAVFQINQLKEQAFSELEMKVDAWFHITRHGGYHALHNHPMASWSGVYCASPGDSPPSGSDSGALSLANPLAMANMFIDPTNANMREPFRTTGVGIHFMPGELVVFPSWLWHQAMPYFGHSERVTIAFNAWFQTRP